MAGNRVEVESVEPVIDNLTVITMLSFCTSTTLILLLLHAIKILVAWKSKKVVRYSKDGYSHWYAKLITHTSGPSLQGHMNIASTIPSAITFLYSFLFTPCKQLLTSLSLHVNSSMEYERSRKYESWWSLLDLYSSLSFSSSKCSFLCDLEVRKEKSGPKWWGWRGPEFLSRFDVTLRTSNLQELPLNLHSLSSAPKLSY